MQGPIAHLGHWIADLLYLAPVIVLAIAVLWQKWRERRERRTGGTLHRSARITEEDSTDQQ